MNILYINWNIKHEFITGILTELNHIIESWFDLAKSFDGIADKTEIDDLTTAVSSTFDRPIYDDSSRSNDTDTN